MNDFELIGKCVMNVFYKKTLFLKSDSGKNYKCVCNFEEFSIT